MAVEFLGGSDQAVFRPDGIFGEAQVYWSVAEMQNGNPGNINPTTAGNFQLRAGYPQLGWAYIKAGR